MATPSPAPESPPAADPAPAAGSAEEAECPPPPQPQPPQNVLAAPRLRAPSSRGLGAAEFGGAAGDVEAPGETFAQRVSLGPAESPPGSRGSGSLGRAPPFPSPFPSLEGDLASVGGLPAPRASGRPTVSGPAASWPGTAARGAGSRAEPRLRESALRQQLAGSLNPARNLSVSCVDPVFTGTVGNGKSGVYSGLLGRESLTLHSVCRLHGLEQGPDVI